MESTHTHTQKCGGGEGRGHRCHPSRLCTGRAPWSWVSPEHLEEEQPVPGEPGAGGGGCQGRAACVEEQGQHGGAVHTQGTVGDRPQGALYDLGE